MAPFLRHRDWSGAPLSTVCATALVEVVALDKAGNHAFELTAAEQEPVRSDATEEDGQGRRRRSVLGLRHSGAGIIRALAGRNARAAPSP